MQAIRKRLQSFVYAGRGIFLLFSATPNARIHLAATVLVVAAGFYFRVSRLEWALLILSVTTVIAAEALNTALEQLTDLASPGFHPLAGKAKDVAAGAVLLTALGAAMVGLLIFVPKIAPLLKW